MAQTSGVGYVGGMEVRVPQEWLDDYVNAILEFERYRSPSLDQARRKAHNRLAEEIRSAIIRLGWNCSATFGDAKLLASQSARAAIAERQRSSIQKREIANLQHFSAILREEILPLSEEEFSARSLHRRAGHQYLEQIVESVDNLLTALIEDDQTAERSYKGRALQASRIGLISPALASQIARLAVVRNKSVHENDETNVFPHLPMAIELAEQVIEKFRGVA